jgi:hypothetical protein
MSSISPDIVTDGLILCLDAANPKCFQSGQTTAKDLVQGFNCSGANGTPGTGTHTPDTDNFPAYSSVNSGVFDFAGGRGINVDGNLGSTTSSAISMWLYKNSNATQYITDGRNDGGAWFLSNYSNYNMTWTNNLRYNFEGSYNSGATDFKNKWIHIVANSDSTGSQLYINGSEVTLYSSSSPDEDFGINYRIGTRYTTSSEWTGLMGPIHFYNKRLTAKEVHQNFNATRGRFGV